MPNLLVKPRTPDTDGEVLSVSPESAGWRHVGFKVFRLQAGQSLARETGSEEVCLVLLTGKADVEAGGESFADLGERMSVFEDKAPYSVYVPNDSHYKVTAKTALELAVCSAPGQGNHPVRLIAPEDVGYEERGSGTNKRLIYNILPETEPADSLLVVEVITPNGCWSSYPPHKHDVHKVDAAGGANVGEADDRCRRLGRAGGQHERDGSRQELAQHDDRRGRWHRLQKIRSRCRWAVSAPP